MTSERALHHAGQAHSQQSTSSGDEYIIDEREGIASRRPIDSSQSISRGGIDIMTTNRALHRATKAQQDEFYTTTDDIESELLYYMDCFRGKTVLCNCDDPFESEFFKYFAIRFNGLGLKKLIATCYAGSPIAHTQLTFNFDDTPNLNIPRPERKAYCAIIEDFRDYNGDTAEDLDDIRYILEHNVGGGLTELKGNGDFRSPECIEYLKQADIVVTNPPHSLLRECIAQLFKYDKQFLILGNINAITYKEVFPLFMSNRLRLGLTIHSGDRKFYVPENYPLEAAGCGVDEKGRRFIRVKGVRWLTNLEPAMRRQEDVLLYMSYDPEHYPKYDNYDAIEVSKTDEIPRDYDGVMGVPITFLDKYDPSQFEILGMTTGRNEFAPEAWPTKRYIRPIQHNPDGTTINGSQLNSRAAIPASNPKGIYYTADNADQKLQVPYVRLLIRRKPEDFLRD